MSSKSGDTDSIIRAAESMAEDNVGSSPSTQAAPERVVLSSGVVLEVFTGISLSAMNDIDVKFPDPPVPIVEVDGREVENPDSPTYKAEFARIGRMRGLAVIDAMIILCTRFISKPPDLDDPESEEWLEKLELLGYETPKGKLGRYLMWVKLQAAPTDSDWADLSAAAARRVGVREEDVQRALAQFQGDSAGDAPVDSKA